MTMAATSRIEIRVSAALMGLRLRYLAFLSALARGGVRTCCVCKELEKQVGLALTDASPRAFADGTHPTKGVGFGATNYGAFVATGVSEAVTGVFAAAGRPIGSDAG